MTGHMIGLLITAGAFVALVTLILGVFFHRPRQTDE